MSADAATSTPDLQRCVAALEAFPSVLNALLEHVAPDEARHKPAAEVWSIVEVIFHLVDEEVHDFRERLRRTLDDADQPWPAIDPANHPPGVNDQDLPTLLTRFAEERAASVDWLRSLNANSSTGRRRTPTPSGRPAPAICSLRGSPTTCCTCANWPSASTNSPPPAPAASTRHTKTAMIISS